MFGVFLGVFFFSMLGKVLLVLMKFSDIEFR